MSYIKLKPPTKGQKITMGPGMKLNVPDNPIVLYIEGDGTGPDLWAASVRVFDAAVQKAYNGKRRIEWFEVYAGEKCNKIYGEGNWLHDDTTNAFKEFLVGIKGPLTTPVGGGIRSINVALRQILDLYVCQRPVKWYTGVPSPVKQANLVDKGTIMKYTEGYFRKWGYELAKKEFADKTVAWDDCGGNPPAGRLLIKDAIADNFLQQILTRPAEYDVIATLNLNGDYISDALAAQVGGIGIAPGANINYLTGHAVFEATHGTAPKYANQDKVNPGSVILSGEMLLRYMGWNEAADRVLTGMAGAIGARPVAY